MTARTGLPHEYRALPSLLRVGRAASVQFAALILLRVIRVYDWMTYDGWIWLDGYEINSAGEAMARRSIFVQVRGLRQIAPQSNARASGRSVR
ncbi:hypothetical protein [Actinoplanes sp. L3-i22]|uniref:hypothetical protein n=1 Tax=Actinoplanes sp. L3-i22 TaxID=2836373 RepID=UPI001C846B21|nr:hypothetical protein [Actinoplanes sp. L3-i22]